MRRCVRCTGTGRVMGGGMIYEDCPDCDGEGRIAPEPESSALSFKQPVGKVFAGAPVDKRSKSYRDAIIEIMDIEGLTREDAVKRFDDVYYTESH